MSEPPPFEKPKPPTRAMTVRELRSVVTARHKYLIASKTFEEALEIVREYGGDEPSCEAFVEWIRGGTATEPPSKGGAVERTHVVTDPETGLERQIETQPGSIPPRPAR